MISIIIPLYNKRKTIKRTIESIFGQTYKDSEIIIVDDGSSDGGIEEAKKFGDKVKIFAEGGHYGANWARNYGAVKSSGDFLFFCDADVIFKKDALEKMKQALDKNKNASYAYCSFRLGWKKMPGRPFDAEALKKNNYISTMSLIRRPDFAGFDEKINKLQDWDLWLTMLEKGKTGIFVKEILFYAKPGKGMSRWLPKIFYKLPWLKEVKKYKEAAKIVKEKHHII